MIKTPISVCKLNCDEEHPASCLSKKVFLINFSSGWEIFLNKKLAGKI